MSSQIDAEKVERIVKRIKGAIRVRTILQECDITQWMSSYNSLINDIFTLRENEADKWNDELMSHLFKELKCDEDISSEDYNKIVEFVKWKRTQTGDHCSG